jgi:hypothetical protein
MFRAGADPGFQVSGGALKKIAPSGGRRENFWSISCEKSRFYAKNHIFSNCGGRRENVWGISCEKSRFYAKKSYFFPILGGRAPGAPPPWIRPCRATVPQLHMYKLEFIYYNDYSFHVIL